ncbi:DUF6992 family protein [Algoriphagus sp.]|uniref:DUF6992 family protein n=1 Tax=Algoriphagus sp. TaxID=1872435 RepID=UPI00391B8339
MDNIIKYFSGEKLQCSIGILIGLMGLGLSVYFIYLNKVVFKGVAFAFIPLSILLLVICVGIVIRTPKDVKRVGTYYEIEPSKMQTEELPRMEKVMKIFPVAKMVEIGFIIVGIFLVLVFMKNDLLKGIGIGLIIQGVMLFGFDHFAESRAKIYFEFLNSI